MEWKNVNDDKPQEMKRILIKDANKYVQIAKRIGDRFSCDDEYQSFGIEDIIGWMELPL